MGGMNFGLTTMLHGICNCIDKAKVIAATRTYIHATDGGSENRSKLMHAMNYVLVIWCRLPPNHSHDYVDRVFSAVEQWLTDPGHPQPGAFTPWEMQV
eukprot:scaffold13002_cov125-Isochrysis_galbana.AAC.14